MATFEPESQAKLTQLHPLLQAVLVIAIKHYPFRILEGYRSPERQLMLYNARPQGTRVKFGTHNEMPARGVDVAPLINGQANIHDREQLCHLAGVIMGIAWTMNIKIRWGNDWNGNLIISERVPGDSWDDLYHLEVQI